MQAAVAENFNQPPHYGEFAEPSAREGEVIVTVKAAALSQLVRLQASGKHYTSGTPPFVPGVDGIGYLADGRRVYFAFPRGPVGAMAQRVAVKSAYTAAVPDDLDDITAAAIANPGMSSWAALTGRAHLQRGETVLINGANGASGRLAIQIAKHLGVGRVVVTGRNPASAAELRALGADEFILLQQEPTALIDCFRAEIANGIDVVLDYLWGPSAVAFFTAASGHGAGHAEPRIRFVNIGSLGGAETSITATALRGSGLELLGSGLGSLSNEALVQSIAGVLQAANSIGLKIETRAVPLTDVAGAWADTSSARTVFTI